MNAQSTARDVHTSSPVGTLTAEPWTGPAGTFPVHNGYDVAVNAESRTYWDGDDVVSILSVHTLVCPLIRAELRGDSSVRVLVYYHAGTRLGLQAHEVVLRESDSVQERLGLRQFVQNALNLAATPQQLQDPTIREMYLHEVIRYLSHPIAANRLQTDDEFAVAQII